MQKEMIAGAGFATMAMKLAVLRARDVTPPYSPRYMPSRRIERFYQQIIARANTGAAAYRAARKLDMLPDGFFTVVL